MENAPIAVVGRGLIGAAAARHLARAGHPTVLIGPCEPADLAAHRGVFASHYDEGRITRALDAETFWSRVSRASIARYGAIEATSGVRFFTEAGAVIAGPEGPTMDRVAAVRRAEAVPADELRGAALAARFPFFAFAPGTVAFHEPRGAGHVSPRRLVAAQTRAAERAGARVVDAEARAISEGPGGVRVRTSAGDVAADRVLVAAGAFTPALVSLPAPLSRYARTVALIEVDPAEARRLAAMPTLIHYDGAGDPYLLPPIRYPDGGLYLKMGGDRVDVRLETDGELRDWFRSGGSPAVAEGLEALVRERLPGLRVRARRSAACVTSFTPSDRPLIERLSDRVAVATAGCGRGAKCSDELGRMGAALLVDLPAAEPAPAAP